MEAQEGDDEIFVYMGGDQHVPERVRRARIHRSVKIVPRGAFSHRTNLISVEFHDEIEMIELDAFNWCTSLRSLKLMGIKVIGIGAFFYCQSMTDVEFGDKLETIDHFAFSGCTALRNITIPRNVRNIGEESFCNCTQLTDLELPEGLETLVGGAFNNCSNLARITMPLKDDMIGDDVFYDCRNLASVDLNGGICNTVASLHLGRWRNELKGEINEINQTLPNTDRWEKTEVVQMWMNTVIIRLNHYKAEHQKILKETATLLELAVWKAKIDQNEETLKPDTRSERRTQRITSGASIIIKNVLPFLELK